MGEVGWSDKWRGRSADVTNPTNVPTFLERTPVMPVLDRFRLDGKRLLITGGSRGLGREMALAIADAGADVVLVGRDEASLARTADDIRNLGRRADTIQADIGSTDSCQSACQKALDEFGPIDILINNVGGRRVPTPTTEMPLATWQQIIDLNLT